MLKHLLLEITKKKKSPKTEKPEIPPTFLGTLHNVIVNLLHLFLTTIVFLHFFILFCHSVNYNDPYNWPFGVSIWSSG